MTASKSDTWGIQNICRRLAITDKDYVELLAEIMILSESQFNTPDYYEFGTIYPQTEVCNVISFPSILRTPPQLAIF